MQVPKTLTTVNSFTKVITAVLFVMLPFWGFIVGIYYEEGVTLKKTTDVQYGVVEVTPTPTPLATGM